VESLVNADVEGKECYMTVFMYILGKAARYLMSNMKCIISVYSMSAAFVVTSSYEVYPFPVTVGLRLLWLTSPNEVNSLPVTASLRLLWLKSTYEVNTLPVKTHLRLFWLISSTVYLYSP